MPVAALGLHNIEMACTSSSSRPSAPLATRGSLGACNEGLLVGGEDAMVMLRLLLVVLMK